MGSTTGCKVIACDLDDTLSQTNSAVGAWHNHRYGTSMTLNDFYYYHYWKNPGWGTPEETINKLEDFYRSEFFLELLPVPGAKEGLESLIARGYSISVVTARGDDQKAITEYFIEKWFPGLIDKIHYTGEFVGDQHGNGGKTTKYEICRSISAVALIDDNLNHVLSCAKGQPPVPTVLFGEYVWNRRLSGSVSEVDRMSYGERLSMEGRPGWWEAEEVDELPASVKRSLVWKEVVNAVDSIVLEAGEE